MNAFRKSLITATALGLGLALSGDGFGTGKVRSEGREVRRPVQPGVLQEPSGLLGRHLLRRDLVADLFDAAHVTDVQGPECDLRPRRRGSVSEQPVGLRRVVIGCIAVGAVMAPAAVPLSGTYGAMAAYTLQAD